MMYVLFILIILACMGFLLKPVYDDKSLPHGRIALVMMVCFLVGGLGLYGWFGAPDVVRLMALRQEHLAELKRAIAASSAQLKANPNNLAAWVELGEDFMQTGQFDAAANAFRHGVVLSKGNPAVILAYAQALIERDDGKVGDDAKKSLEMVVLQDPKNPRARYYLIVRKLQDGKQSDAMKEMKALYHELPDDSPLKAMIDRQIGRSN